MKLPFQIRASEILTPHTREGYALRQRAAEAGFEQAARERDEPFGDAGPVAFKPRSRSE